ncbi:MAG: AAA family ATPase [bacterium]
MKITQIKFQNILSFNDFTWSGINDGLNVVVGPNGAGKPNIFIAINFLKDYLSNPYNNYNFDKEYKWLIKADKKDTDKCKICIGIEFDKNDEKDLFKYFFTSILQTTIISDLSLINQEIFKYNDNNPTATLFPINQNACLYKVLDKINVEFIDDFFKGTLIFEINQNNPSVSVYYIFAKSSKQICLYLNGGQFHNSLIIGNEEPLLNTAPSATIKNFSSYNDLKSKIPEAYNQCINHQEFSNTTGLSFSFDEILNEVINGSKYYRISDLSVSNLNNLPSLNSGKKLIKTLNLNPNGAVPPPSFISLFNHIIREKIINLDNFRIPYKKEYPVSEIENSYPNLANGKDLALYLHKLRNGVREERTTFEEIDKLFFLIAKAHLNLRYQFLSENQNYNQLMPLSYSASSPAIDNNKTENSEHNSKDKVKFTITVTKKEGNIEIPLEYSGAGIQELVLLISLLKMSSSEGCIILLDEPAVNLHPIMQKKLLNEFNNIINDKEQGEQNINKNQIFIISHSSHFIPKEKFLSKSVKRIYLNDNSYSAISSEIEEENADNIISMLRITNFAGNLISSLFASSVILCEGDDDYLALPVWFEKYKYKEGNSLHDYNIMLFPLDGWNNIKYAISFLKSFNIPYVALLDSDTMLNGKKSIFNVLKKLDIINESEIISLSKNNISKNNVDKAIEKLKEKNIFIYGDNNLLSREGKLLRDIIREDPCISCDKYSKGLGLNGKYYGDEAEKIAEKAKEKYNIDNKKKALSIYFAEETEPPEEIKALFDKALELAGAER